VAATLGMVILVWACAQGRQEDSAMVGELRARLQSIVNQESDDRFLEECLKLLEGIGVGPALWKGSDLPLGRGIVSEGQVLKRGTS